MRFLSTHLEGVGEGGGLTLIKYCVHALVCSEVARLNEDFGAHVALVHLCTTVSEDSVHIGSRLIASHRF